MLVMLFSDNLISRSLFWEVQLIQITRTHTDIVFYNYIYIYYVPVAICSSWGTTRPQQRDKRQHCARKGDIKLEGMLLHGRQWNEQGGTQNTDRKSKQRWGEDNNKLKTLVPRRTAGFVTTSLSFSGNVNWGRQWPRRGERGLPARLWRPLLALAMKKGTSAAWKSWLQ